MNYLLRVIALFALALSVGPASLAAQDGRVIVLGFDGADAERARVMMDAGRLPNLTKLRDQGTFAPLHSTVPAESPVAWATANSGANPAKTGIPGFVKRSFADGLPAPDLGFKASESRALDEAVEGGLVGFLASTSPVERGGLVGGAALLVFWALFALLLKLRAKVAFVLALLLGLLGAAGAVIAGRWLPERIEGIVTNPTQTSEFWEDAARAGVKSVVIDAAMSWDRPAVDNLELLAGLGVPDARGQYGDWFIYTDAQNVFQRAPLGTATSTGGKVFRVDFREGRAKSFVYGPLDQKKIGEAREELAEIADKLGRPGLSDARVDELRARREQLDQTILPRLLALDGTEEGRVSLPLDITADGEAWKVAIGGQEQRLAVGQWSDWYRLTFEIDPLLKVRAITRAKVTKGKPFELYVDMLHLDPADAPRWQAVSRPHNFGADLCEQIGEPYETVGWACITMPLKDRRIDAVTFLQDIEFTARCREKLIMGALERGARLVVGIESTPDRVQHMLYHLDDAEHPGHDPELAATKTLFFGREIELRDAIERSYEQMDELVGKVMAKLAPNDILLVVADHGFQSFRRQVHLNTWLAQEGYLTLRDGVSLGDAGDIGAYVDWTRTKAYAIGLGTIYLNLQGRERLGTVAPEDAPALLDELIAKLKAMKDGNGSPVRTVYKLADIHSGKHLEDEAELCVGFEGGWRASWATTSGGIRLSEQDGKVVPASPFEDSLSPWSGDHVSVAGDLVRGIFYSNRSVTLPPEGPDLLHLAPTVLTLLGVPVPAQCDRPALPVQR